MTFFRSLNEDTCGSILRIVPFLVLLYGSQFCESPPGSVCFLFGLHLLFSFPRSEIRLGGGLFPGHYQTGESFFRLFPFSSFLSFSAHVSFCLTGGFSPSIRTWYHRPFPALSQMLTSGLEHTMTSSSLFLCLEQFEIPPPLAFKCSSQVDFLL